MATLLLMPSLSPTMEVGVISTWKKKPGEKVEIGEVLAEIETDKAVMEWEMADEGIIRTILAKTGEEIKVGTPIAILANSADEDISALEAQAKAGGGAPAAAKSAAAPAAAPAAPAPKAAAAPVPAAAPTPAHQAAAAASNGERVKISPYGKKLAEQNHVAWHGLAGSGPGGRIVAQDVQAAMAGGATGGAAMRGPVAAPAPG
ncbi:MAG TPA: biotin/lipoyl-containing protein, partial [bacterium]